MRSLDSMNELTHCFLVYLWSEEDKFQSLCNGEGELISDSDFSHGDVHKKSLQFPKAHLIDSKFLVSLNDNFT